MPTFQFTLIDVICGTTGSQPFLSFPTPVDHFRQSPVGNCLDVLIPRDIFFCHWAHNEPGS